MKGLNLLFSAVAAATLIGCESSLDTPTQDGINESGFFAVYDPSAGKLPFPTNLLFTGTDATLTLNIPPSAGDTAGTTAVKAALNNLDGFSTTAPISVNFTSPIDPTTLIGQDTVRVFKVALTGIAEEVGGVLGELTVNVDYVVSTSSVDSADGTEKGANKLVISPLKPLEPKTSYMVVVTKGVKSTAGESAASDVVYAFSKSGTALHTGGVSDFTALTDADAVSLEPLRNLNNASETVVSLETTDLNASDIVVSWSFTTQSVGDVLTAVRTAVDGGAIPEAAVVDSGTDSPLSAADIYVGTLNTTYYLHVPTSLTDDTDALSPTSGSWQDASSAPVTQYNTAVNGTSQTIPLMLSIPKTAKPVGGWPVVIFQHGITGNRTNMLGLADSMAMAGQGFAVVAIDMPLHGLTGCEASGVGNYRNPLITERTFDVDFKDNATEVTPDEDNCIFADDATDIDPSGTHFINLESLLTSRDNVRQAVADLFVLRKALEGLDYDTGGADFDLTRIHFAGHSLGGIVGGTFLALEPTVKASVLGMSGGGIAKLLDGSATFGPILEAGLGLNGVAKGTADYESFLASAQMALDSGDPVNYTSATVASRDVLLFEVIGDGVDSLADQVVPNNVIGVSGTVNAPLSGTDPLVSLMSLTQLDTSTTYVANTDTVVKFVSGHHSSFLTPDFIDGSANIDPATAEYKAYAEMQTEAASFIASDGAVITHTDSAAEVIATVPALP